MLDTAYDTAAMADVYFTLQEVANRLKVSYRTVFRWVHSEELPAYKFGSEWRVRLEDLEEFEEARRTPPRG